MSTGLTKTERYLLRIICTLRGIGYDGWGRLNSIRLKKESLRQAASKADIEEMLEQLNSPESGGAGLPFPDRRPGIGSSVKRRRELLKALRKIERIWKEQGRWS